MQINISLTFFCILATNKNYKNDSIYHLDSDCNLLWNIVPDFTSCNILHSHASKILTEWPNKTEIPNQKILDFIIRPFVNDTSSLILIPKYNTSVLCIKFEKTSPEKVSDFLLLSYIFNHYKKSQEFSYFELYRKQK